MRAFSRWIPRLALVLIAASIPGCRPASRFLWRQPTVALRGVSLDAIGVTGGALRVSLLVRNPNFYPLSTAGMQYRLLVGDSLTIAEGTDSTNRRVPAHDSVVVVLPVTVSWRGLSAAGNDIVSNGLVPYRIVGNITLDTPLGKHDVPVSQSGRFAPIH